MEPAKIDWKNVVSVFVEDSLYEHINAPKWVDFSAPDDKNQDEAWFCRPDCNHPKTAEDFYKLSPPSKLLSMVGISDMLQLRDRTKREANLKRRQPVVDGRSADNSENNDPNLSTPPPIPRTKSVKEAFKSSADHKQPKVLESPEQTPKLKTVRSARNLLGRDIFSHITEFCNELKKLAIRAKEKEADQEVAKSAKNDTNSGSKHQDDDRMDVDEVARTPLLGISKEKFGYGMNSGEKKLRRKKRNDELENTPLAMDLNCIRNQESQNLLKSRTNPPTPQCFSAVRGQARATPTPTPNISVSKSKFTERSILQEVVKTKRMEHSERSKTNNTTSAVAEKEAKPLDVFWFLKPCTLSEASS
ncbi:unnamed protein product [Rhodiola kirilowii]